MALRQVMKNATLLEEEFTPTGNRYTIDGVS
jgi:hypothetical protein